LEAKAEISVGTHSYFSFVWDLSSRQRGVGTNNSLEQCVLRV